jgi:predicted nucleic-acid-binding protein
LFTQARNGTLTLVTTSTIIAEITYVLTSLATYRFPRTDVTERLLPLLSLQGLHIDHKDEIMAALDLWAASRMDFEDCLAVETTRRMSLDGIFTYDRGFDGVPDIRRLEP